MGGGKGGGRMERRLSRRACTERECHTYPDTWCVCVCMCVSEQKGKPSCSTGGGWEIEWPYIHKDMVGGCMCVCVCACGKRENHPVPQGGVGGGFSFLPGPHAQLENHKTAGVGGGEAEGYPVPRRGGGGRGEYTMTSITYRNIEYITGYHGGGGGVLPWRNQK